MKKLSKVLSVVLAMIMACSCFAFVASAEESTAVDYTNRVNGWNANYELFLDHLFDDSSFTSWSYVDINEKAMKDTMATWTAFALYDEAWRNYVTKELDINQAKEILLAIIQRAEYDFDDGYVDEFAKILKYAQKVEDVVDAAGKIIKADGFQKVIKSETWNTIWKVIGDVKEIVGAYQFRRDQFIEEYAKVLSVQLANQYYIDLIQYIADTTPYEILKKAANELIADMNKGVKDVVEEVLFDALADGVSLGLDRLITLAANSNVYTAAVLKIYGYAKDVADFLWNTEEVYPHMQTVLAGYYFQSATSEWAEKAYYQEEAEKSYFAIDLLMSTRRVCEEALVNFKLAENDGAVGRIKNKLHGKLMEDTEVNLAGINIMKSMMFDLEPENFKKITDSLYVYCPVSIDLLDNDNSILYTVADGAESLVSNKYGVFTSIYSEFGNDYLKVAYLYDGYRVRLSGTANGYVTLIHKELLDDGTVEDWSFTDLAVTPKTRIVFSTEVEGTPTYTYSENGVVQILNFNDKFIPSEYPEYTAKDVVNAGVEIGKDEVKSIWDQIKEFFESIGEWFKKLFGGK